MPNNFKSLTRKGGAQFYAGPETIDEEKRTVQAVFATENPVEIFDPFKMRAMPEVLLASGMRAPASGKITFLDSHNPGSTKNVLGSAFPGIAGDQVVGEVQFAKSAEPEFEKVRDGHITDFSVGYRVSESGSVYVSRGEEIELSGRSFAGPAVIRKEWELKELSLVVFGADESAKVRSEGDDITNEETENKREKEKRDMPEIKETKEPEEIRNDPVEEKNRAEKKPDAIDVEAVRKAAIEEARRAERERISSIRSICRQFNKDSEKFETEDMSLDAVRQALLAELAEEHKTRSVATHGEDESDKWARQSAHGLMLRAGRGHMVDEKYRGEAHPVASMTAMEFGKECLRRAGVDYTYMDPMEIAKRAMTTSDFSNVINTTANKSLKVGYMERRYLWQDFCSIGSAPNYLPQTEVEVSRGGVLQELTTENPEYPMKYFTDGAQTYSLKTYAGMWRFSRKMMINDQMNIVVSAERMGQTAGRTIEKNVFAYIESNPTMSDGNALFSVAHANIAVGGDIDPPSIATLNEAELAMASQLDIDEETKLDIQPVFLLAPTDIKGYTSTFLGSPWYSDQATLGTVDEANASTRKNIWMGKLQEIYTAKFTSTTAWYLLGEKGETFEVFFLNGRQEPIMESEFDFNTKDYKVTLSSDHGVRAKDWKAMYYNAGT